MGVKLLGKIKIHEIAKEIGLTSKEVIEKAHELGIEVKSHMSGVEKQEAERIKSAIAKKGTGEKAEDKKQDSKKNDVKSKESKKVAPVIIRREVIIADEDEKQKEVAKKEQKNKQVGFVERNKNADYNIVYRNKPTKPMTVSELFGIGKKEESKKEEPKKEEVKEAKEIK